MTDAGLTPVVVSLTRTAAREAAGRVDLPRDQVGTLHGLCYRNLDNRPSLVKKTDLEDPQDGWNDKYGKWALSHSLFSGQNTDDLDSIQPKELGDEIYQSVELRLHRMTPKEHWTHTQINFHDAWTKWKRDRNIIDFTDMIRLAPTYPPKEADAALVDEAQDHSKLEQHLVQSWIKHLQAIIYVGDPYQSLFDWRGANPKLLSHPDREQIPESHQDVLSQSYRLPPNIYAYSANWIKQLSDYKEFPFQPRRDGNEGVCKPIPANGNSPMRIIQHAVETNAKGQSFMIAATCGYMLRNIIQEMSELGVPYSNPWRITNGLWNPLYGPGTRMSDRIVALVKPIIDRRLWTDEELWKIIEHLETKTTLIQGAKTRQKKFYEDRINNPHFNIVNFEDLKTIFQPHALSELWNLAFETADLTRLIDWWASHLLTKKLKSARYPIRVMKRNGLDSLNERPKIYVGTCHSFKGAEADCVALLPDISPKAWEGYKFGPGPGYDSVIRTFYVGMTRAREELYLCRPSMDLAIEW